MDCKDSIEAFNKFKQAIIASLNSDARNLDKSYLVSSSKQWSRRKIGEEIARRIIVEELENESEEAVERMVNIMLFATELLTQAIKNEDHGLEN